MDGNDAETPLLFSNGGNGKRKCRCKNAMGQKGRKTAVAKLQWSFKKKKRRCSRAMAENGRKSAVAKLQWSFKKKKRRCKIAMTEKEEKRPLLASNGGKTKNIVKQTKTTTKMATRIPDLRIERLRAATYLEMMKDVVETGGGQQGVERYTPQQFARLRAAVKEMQDEMEVDRKSPYTKQIAEKDTQRDSALVMAKTMLHNMTLNGTPQQQLAAKYLEEMAKLMKVKVSPQYDQQTGEITVAVSELLGKFATYTDAAGIRPQVEQLKRLNDEMCELLRLRDTEKGAQGRSKLAEIRLRIDVIYRDLIDQVNAIDIVFQLGQLKGDPQANPCTAFIDHMLGVIDRFKREILKNGGASGEIVEGEEVEEEVTEEETTTPGGSEGGGDSDNSGSTDGGTTGSGSGSNGSTGGSGSGTGSNPGSGSGTGIPIQPGPGGDDPDL